jgi:hypothetical protein
MALHAIHTTGDYMEVQNDRMRSVKHLLANYFPSIFNAPYGPKSFSSLYFPIWIVDATLTLRPRMRERSVCAQDIVMLVRHVGLISSV